MSDASQIALEEIQVQNANGWGSSTRIRFDRGMGVPGYITKSYQLKTPGQVALEELRALPQAQLRKRAVDCGLNLVDFWRFNSSPNSDYDVKNPMMQNVPTFSFDRSTHLHVVTFAPWYHSLGNCRGLFLFLPASHVLRL